MFEFIEKLKDILLGVEEETDEEQESVSRDSSDREGTVRGYERHTASESPRDIDYIKAERREKEKEKSSSNVVNFRAGQTEEKMSLVITHPTEVRDATAICDHVRNNKICVVNLEGLDRDKSQRIADFLGGVSYALKGEVERISNEIFVIAPTSVQISDEMRAELKAESRGMFRASSDR